MRSVVSWKKRVAALAVVAVGCAAGALTVASPASAASCTDVQVVFARGTLELPGLGLAGTPFVNGVKKDLPGKTVSSYAVNYSADVLQSSGGAGSKDMTDHVKQVAAQCPTTKFILGGYSQGATVVDKSIGVPILLGGTGEAIPANLASRVSAAVVFGNPLAIFGGHITSSLVYGSRSKEFCNSGDPVCANGVNILAHLAYGSDGSAAKGAQFAADKVKSS
jgi:cutinase